MFKLPQLTYDVGALAPWVSAATMTAHHDHHHQTYVDKLNAAVEQLPPAVLREYFAAHRDGGAISPDFLRPFLDDLAAGRLDAAVPTALRQTLRNQGGGHFNHALFWLMLAPRGDGEPAGELAQKLAAQFGSFQKFTEDFATAATGLFGAGWAWLTVAPRGELQIETTPNQGLPTGKILLGLDVWEHAYYLDYKWNRADYVKAWWPHVDWDFAARRFSNFAKN